MNACTSPTSPYPSAATRWQVDDELPNAPLLLDHPRVSADVRNRRNGVDELRQYGAPAHLREALTIAEQLPHAHDVDRRALGRELDGSFVDAPIGFGIEVFGLEVLEHLVERVALEQNGREHRRLGVEIVRRHPAAHGRRRGAS